MVKRHNTHFERAYSVPKLTELGIRALQPPQSGQKVYWDDIPGFGVRLSQGGAKTFILVQGSGRKRTTIGRFPTISLQEARAAARHLLAERTIGKHIPASLRSKMTTAEAIEAFLAHCAHKNATRTIADYKRLLNRHIPAGKLVELSREDLLTRLKRLSRVPGEQAHAATAAQIFLNWCAAAGHITANPIAGARGIGHIKKRQRTLTSQELATVLKAALAYPFPYGTIVALCITTGQRRSEIGYLRRTYLADHSIHLPPELTKNGGRVPGRGVAE